MSKVVLAAHNEDGFTKVDDASSSEKFEGYEGFYSKITFDKDGKFLKQGFWE